MPVALISTITSPWRGPARSTSPISRGAPAWRAMAARVSTILFLPLNEIVSAAQDHDTVANRAATVGAEGFEKDRLAAAGLFTGLDADYHLRRHQHHRAEAAVYLHYLLGIVRRFPLHDRRDGQCERRGTVQDQTGQPRRRGDGQISMDWIPDSCAFGIDVRRARADRQPHLETRLFRDGRRSRRSLNIGGAISAVH